MGDQHKHNKHILAHLETEFHQNFKPEHLAEICCWSNVRGHMSQFVQGVNFLNPKLLIMRSIWIRQKYDVSMIKDQISNLRLKISYTNKHVQLAQRIDREISSLGSTRVGIRILTFEGFHNCAKNPMRH